MEDDRICEHGATMMEMQQEDHLLSLTFELKIHKQQGEFIQLDFGD
jgi:hypothetical protein